MTTGDTEEIRDAVREAVSEVLGKGALEAAIRDAVREAAEAQHAVLKDTIRAALVELGLDPDEPSQMREDFRHLRGWRVATDDLASKGRLALATVVVSGLLTALWLGVKALVGSAPSP